MRGENHVDDAVEDANQAQDLGPVRTCLLGRLHEARRRAKQQDVHETDSEHVDGKNVQAHLREPVRVQPSAAHQAGWILRCDVRRKRGWA